MAADRVCVFVAFLPPTFISTLQSFQFRCNAYRCLHVKQPVLSRVVPVLFFTFRFVGLLGTWGDGGEIDLVIVVYLTDVAPKPGVQRTDSNY